MVHTGVADISPGGSSEAAPPVPIPNTVVKRLSAYDTALVTEWENRSPPGGISSANPPKLHFPSLRLSETNQWSPLPAPSESSAQYRTPGLVEHTQPLY